MYLVRSFGRNFYYARNSNAVLVRLFSLVSESFDVVLVPDQYIRCAICCHTELLLEDRLHSICLDMINLVCVSGVMLIITHLEICRIELADQLEIRIIRLHSMLLRYFVYSSL